MSWWARAGSAPDWCAPAATRSARSQAPERRSRTHARGWRRVRDERGQAAILLLGVVAAAIAGTLILAAFGQAYGARSHVQRRADLAAIAAAQTMQREYPRLFDPGPTRLSLTAYETAARGAAMRGGRAN